MKISPLKTVCNSAIFSILVHVHLLRAETQPANRTVPALFIFGDSIVDPGNNNNNLLTVAKANFAPYGKDFYGHIPTGRFGNGKLITDFIASSLGLKDLLPAYLDPNLQISDLLTGVSFASGGTGFDNLTAQLMSVLTLPDQLELFKESIGRIMATVGEEKALDIISKSIYGIIAGTDDLVNNYFPLPIRRSSYTLPQYLDLMVQSASSFIQELYRLGARRLALLGLPPVGCIPSQRTLAGGINRNCVAPYNQAALMFNSKLSREVKSLKNKLPGSKIVLIDAYNPLLRIIQNPYRYGFEEATRGCCGTGTVEVVILCNPTSYVCPDDSKYVFWDSYHPSEKTYRIIEAQVYNKYIPQLL